MKKITEKSQLIKLAHDLGVRPDWHEPDEQDVTVSTHGTSFDNAGFWPAGDPVPVSSSILEKHVVIKQNGKPVAVVNLATLFAWASRS